VRKIWLLWLTLAALYAGFRLWYDGGGPPLTPEEVARYTAILAERGAEPERIEAVRGFLASDPGGEFVMANLIRFREAPLEVGEVRPGESPQQTLDRYMAHMFPALLRRACHPVLVGSVVGRALEAWGIQAAEPWSLAGLVRYRSRRDMIEIATDRAFADAHLYKEAAMDQTIAVPVEPFFSLASPRWLVAVVLVAIGALGHIATARRT
jgi:hypothetical protein